MGNNTKIYCGIVYVATALEKTRRRYPHLSIYIILNISKFQLIPKLVYSAVVLLSEAVDTK